MLKIDQKLINSFYRQLTLIKIKNQYVDLCIGDFVTERYRERLSIENGKFIQGRGAKGVIVCFVQHKLDGDVLCAELNTGEYIEIIWLSKYNNNLISWEKSHKIYPYGPRNFLNAQKKIKL